MDFEWSWTLDFIGRRASFTPHHEVLYEAEQQRYYSYGDLNDRANRLAAYLTLEAGLNKGERVAVLARNCIEYFDFLFASIKTGIILVPLNIRLSAGELSEMLRQTTPRLLAYEHSFDEVVAKMDWGMVDKLILLKKKKKTRPELKAEEYDRILDCGKTGSHSPNVIIMPEDPLLILFTGGTTGPAKGAVISHRSVFFNMLSETISWQLGPGTVVPNLLPLFHTGGWNLVTLPTLFAGGRLLINSTFDPELTLRQVTEKKCSFLFAAPTMFRMISDHANFSRADLSSLQFVMSGAAPCPVSVMEPYWERDVTYVQGYGITEGGPNNLYMPWYSLNRDQVRKKNQSVGIPFLYCRTRIVNDEETDVAPGEMGELLLGGPVIFSGYWNKPEESEKTLRHGWVHTGDVARQDEDGYFYIVDRKKDMYISGGENVFPVEVEKVITSHPRIMEAAVIGIPDSKWGEAGKAFIVLKQGEEMKPDDLQDFLRARLARYKVPREVIFVDSIPKSGVGKVLKRELDA